MKRAAALLFAVWVLLLLARCHLPEPVLAPEASTVPVDSSTIYVIRHGWHAGIAVRTEHLPPDALPPMPGGAEARYLELGWGERNYYPNPDPGVWTFARAGLWPTASVVHVVPVRNAIPVRFSQQPIVQLRIGGADLRRLAAYLRASLTVDASGQVVPVAPGYHPKSQFVASPLRYHVFQNCNHWAAEALEAAGCSTARWRTLTVGAVLGQAAACGTRLR